MTLTLLEGSLAIVESSLAAGCRFFAGYPMTPFTELLEHFAERLPQEGGVCVNAESEIEAVNMAMGAAATGARAATGSTGQGLALMQEGISEAFQAQIPVVLFNMARGQQEYLQATRGGGHGDYHVIALAPRDVREAVELTALAFHLSDTWRMPVLVYGDYLIAHTHVGVDATEPELPPRPDKPWAIDGTAGGTGRSRSISSFGFDKPHNPSPGPEAYWRGLADKCKEIADVEARAAYEHVDGAETVVVAFGSVGGFVERVVDDLRGDGVPIGSFRPITLWPFPAAQLRDAAANASRVLVFELNAGQMIQDVRLALEGAVPTESLGGITSDGTGLRPGSLLDPVTIRAELEQALARKEGG